jgi:hypothetical protein
MIALIAILSIYFVVWVRPARPIRWKGFGWYGYLADDEITLERLRLIKQLGGNSININVYYEYVPENRSIVMLSNLTKIKEKIELAHNLSFGVFLSPFVNLLGGRYMASYFTKISEAEQFLESAKHISIRLAEFADQNDVEMYAVWNELGLALLHLPNSTLLTSRWLQGVRRRVDEVYDGLITTKEGVQLGLYRGYNFSYFDCLGVTFYPFTTSFATDPATGLVYGGVESLEEYQQVVKEEVEWLVRLKNEFKLGCIVLGEIGIDVVADEFVGYDEWGIKTRGEAYRVVLKESMSEVDGFFFGKIDHIGDEFKSLLPSYWN